MGSVGNSNQWQPYAYKDCSLEICSIYCPQWCYIIFPPPPPFGYGANNSDSPTDFSPLIIAIIGILASAFILVSYYTIISKYCRNRAAASSAAMDVDDEENLAQIRHGSQLQAQAPPAGLDEALIKSITVCKYIRGDGLVEGTDCSVCLSEFQENESLRLLPKCSHAFHLPCIDTWLKSHSTCPLCRSNISPTNLFPPPTQEIQRTEQHINNNAAALQYQHRSNDTVVVVVVQDLATVSQQQTAVLGMEINDGAFSKNQRQSFASDSHQDSEPRHEIIQVTQDDVVQPFRRSVSLDSLPWQGQVSVADILRESQDSEEEVEEHEMQMGIGIGSSKVFVQEHCQSNHKNGVSNLGMNRSVSTGRLGFTNYEKGKSSIIPS